jgi:uncharacterized protein YndB with AHSA1/START domain
MATATGNRATVTLPTDEQILVRREFDAPQRLVFEAWTSPELVARWWTAGLGEATSVEIDLRVGGRWRYVMTDPEGGVFAFHGDYRDVVPHERLVSTEVYENLPDQQAVNTVTFEAVGERTVVTMLVEHETKEARDRHLGYGMEEGMQQALVMLEQLVRSTR